MLALEELSECVPGSDGTENWAERETLVEALDRFLGSLKPQTRIMFLRRYWYINRIGEIAADLHVSESKVKMTLSRTRKALKEHLEKEGINL